MCSSLLLGPLAAEFGLGRRKEKLLNGTEASESQRCLHHTELSCGISGNVLLLPWGPLSFHSKSRLESLQGVKHQSGKEGTAQVALGVKKPSANARDVRDMGSVPGTRRFHAGGHGGSLQYSCLENPRDRGAWWATVHGVTNSQTWLKWLSMHR